MGQSGIGKSLKRQGLNRKQRKHARHNVKLSKKQLLKKTIRLSKGLGYKK